MDRLSLIVGLLSIALFLCVPSCGRDSEGGPPTIRLGDSVCNECGMILSDERFATATIIQADREQNAMLFDDFNCQLIFERKHPDLSITKRWSHDYSSLKWFKTESGWFVRSPEIHSPMASNRAIFQDRADAEALSKSVSGEIQDFATAWIQTD